MVTKKESVIELIRIQCGLCNTSYDYIKDEVDITSHSDECGMCGSHGDVEVSFKCFHCKKYSEISISSW